MFAFYNLSYGYNSVSRPSTSTGQHNTILGSEYYTISLYVSERRRTPLCVGCGSTILDQFILRVAPDLEWHASCLKCAECNQHLDESCTCFVRDGKTYCKRDYSRLVCEHDYHSHVGVFVVIVLVVFSITCSGQHCLQHASFLQL